MKNKVKPSESIAEFCGGFLVNLTYLLCVKRKTFNSTCWFLTKSALMGRTSAPADQAALYHQIVGKDHLVLSKQH
ncbi:hypothetical protein C5167_044624 [Papaver somniferum]|uniref:Uncharacterized protein n=1 Tax=Papaver somniferum TaxID=3469 RepID=A0A4Y7LBN3_PAPSO|nr:hypothetical protein C5167_044624 [Papaver somniferum]